jgi:putative FmdB family regulatory protein
MPTYQYACTNPACGERFELVQSFTDPAASACPVCEGPVRKVFSAVGVVFKGSGFYRTDSRSGNGKSSNGSPASSGESSSAGKESKEPAASTTSSSSSDSSTTTSTGSGTAPAGKAAASA